MKYTSLCIVLAILCFSSCKKDSGASTNFQINGIHDLNLTGGSSASLNGLEVKFIAGKQEPVVLTATNLPAGVVADFTPASGTPTYFFSVTFYSDASVAAGDYTIKIIGTSSTSVTKSYDMVLHVTKANYWKHDNVNHFIIGTSWDKTNVNQPMFMGTDVSGNAFITAFNTATITTGT
jgi:hypothetical protein